MLKGLISTGLRVVRGGKGLSFRTGKYIGEALLIGVLTGFVVVGFRYMIGFGAKYLMGGAWLAALPKGWSRVALAVLPAVGAVLGHLLIRRFAKVEVARGTDSAVRAYHQNGGYVSGTVIPVKSVASVLCVASGGSAGYEGPVTLLGAACGSFVARKLGLSVRARRILMAAGLSAGIGALFQAPLAGALFGFEIFYSSSDVEYETLLPSFTASAVAYTIYACFFGWNSLFTMTGGCVYENGLRLLPYLMLALAVVFGARFYIAFFRMCEERFRDWGVPGTAKVAIGGLLTGLIGLLAPDVLGTSYGVIQTCLSLGSDAPQTAAFGSLTVGVLVGFFFLKAVATSFTVGSGGSGGVFAPALVCGAALGAAVGLAFSYVLPATFDIHPASFALVGMAGFLASAVRIPMTAIVIVAEISGNHGLLLPAMWVCGIAFWLNNGWSLYRSQPHNRASSPVHGSVRER